MNEFIALFAERGHTSFRTSLLVLFLVSVSVPAAAQSLLWEKTYPTTLNGDVWWYINDILLQESGDMIVTGTTGKSGVVFRTDDHGNVRWMESVYDLETNLFPGVGLTGDVPLYGHTSWIRNNGTLRFLGSNSTDVSGMLYIRDMDPETGNPLDTISGLTDSVSYMNGNDLVVRYSGDDFFTVWNWPYHGTYPYGSLMISKTSSNGRYIWDSPLSVDTAVPGVEITSIPRGVAKGEDGMPVIWGHWIPGDTGAPHLFVMKVDTLGQKVWERRIGVDGGEIGIATDVDRMPDGGFVGISEIPWFESESKHHWQDVYVYRFDSEGNLLWRDSLGIGRRLYGRAVRATPDGGIVVCGSLLAYREQPGEVVTDSSTSFYVVKLDASGQQEWWYEWGIPGLRDAMSYATVRDDRVIVGGEQNGKGYLAAISLKTSSVASTGKSQAKSSAYPNPASSTVRLHLPDSCTADHVSVRLVNVFGEGVESRYRFEQGDLYLDVSSLSSGVYHAVILDTEGNSLRTEPIVVRH